jgi:TonB family protein
MIGRLLLMLFFWPGVLAQQTYRPPEVLSAGDAYAPYNIVFDGLFVLDISIGDDGSIGRIEPLRNPGAMLDATKSAIRNWKFQPAFEDRKPRPSRMTVAFVYRPGNYPTFGAVPVEDFKPVIPAAQLDDGGAEDVPVGILSFAYPEYPINSVASGSVLLQATVDSAGDAKSVKILHGMAGFDSFAQSALKSWRFAAASVHGKTVTSKIVVAFIFQSPPSSN